MDLILRLVRQGLINEAQLDDVLAEAEKDNMSVWSELVKFGCMDIEDVLCFLANQINVPYVSLNDYVLDPALIVLVGEELARHFHLIPLCLVNSVLTVAMVDPTNVLAIDEVKRKTGYDVEPVVALHSDIIQVLDQYYGIEELLTTMGKFAESVAPIKSLTSADTRQHPRVQAALGVKLALPNEIIRFTGDRNYVEGSTFDMSLSGALIETAVFIPRNIMLECVFDCAQFGIEGVSTISLPAQVVYAFSHLTHHDNVRKKLYRNGIQFHDVSRESRDMLVRVLDVIRSRENQ